MKTVTVVFLEMDATFTSTKEPLPSLLQKDESEVGVYVLTLLCDCLCECGFACVCVYLTWTGKCAPSYHVGSRQGAFFVHYTEGCE